MALPSAQALRDRGMAACKVSTQYLPSDLEQLWVKNVAAWEADFCNHMAEVENSTRVWLDTLTELRKAQAQYQNANTSPAEVRQGKGQPSSDRALLRRASAHTQHARPRLPELALCWSACILLWHPAVEHASST